jgi:imidazole glycerol-phosphate synthase subunit HisH
VTRIAVLDYGIGNLRSAEKALAHVGADAHLTADPEVIAAADGIVLPGVGAFGPCMDALEASGLDVATRRAVDEGRPFFGICIGMQLLYEGSDEAPDRPGLGILPGVVRALPEGVRRPQMQWNVVDVVAPSAMLAGLDDPIWMYFVHSYAATDRTDVVATCDYGGPVVAAVERGPLWATQFHPEKSGDAGLAVLANFVAGAAATRAAGAA